MAPAAQTRSDPAAIKVIGLGMGRTGTSSLRDALVQLGFGPCYHGTTMMKRDGADLATWSKFSDGTGIPEDLDNILRGYRAALDVPVALYSAELYAAYPDAKFILTVRDPAKWEKSMKATLFEVYDLLLQLPNKTGLNKLWTEWTEEYHDNVEKYHDGRLRTYTQQEFIDHNDRVKRLIPAEKLLVYEVGEGWERLCKFLDVPEPKTPFPHVNDSAEFRERHVRLLEAEVKAVGSNGETNSAEF